MDMDVSAVPRDAVLPAAAAAPEAAAVAGPSAGASAGPDASGSPSTAGVAAGAETARLAAISGDPAAPASTLVLEASAHCPRAAVPRAGLAAAAPATSAPASAAATTPRGRGGMPRRVVMAKSPPGRDQKMENRTCLELPLPPGRYHPGAAAPSNFRAHPDLDQVCEQRRRAPNH